MNKNECLVIDIECYSDQDINSVYYVQDAQIKWIGIYCYEQDKYYEVLIADHPDNKAKTIDFINKYKTIVTFNGNKFDIPILKNNGFITNQWIRSVDCWEALADEKGCKRRGQLMGYDFKSNSLKNMAIAMGLPVVKGDIDYKIFAKNKYSNEEIKAIKKYLRADVQITKLMFDKLYDFWVPITEFLGEKNKRNWSWMKSTIACLGYKIICDNIGVQEEYESNCVSKKYEGGYVLEPIVDEASDVVSFDFSSLYPMIFIQCNLFSYSCSCCSDEEKWNGNNFFNIKGKYCKKTQGEVENLIKKLYILRSKYKKDNNKNQYAIKIIINSIYGAVASPIFKNIYSIYSAEDCTSIGRTCVKTAINMFNDAGFQVIYSDTDSCYVKLNDKSKEDAEIVSNNIVKKLQSNMPFPWK